MTIDNWDHFFYDFLIKQGMEVTSAKYINLLLLVFLSYGLLVLLDFILRKVFLNLFTRISEKTSNNFDNFMVKNKLPRNVAHILPLFIAFELLPVVFVDFPYWKGIFTKMLAIYAVFLSIWIFRSFINTLKDYFKTLPRLKDKPLDSYLQVFMIFAWLVGILFVFAILTNNPIWKFITALGAASAVVLLVFKDTILGFVASIQVSANDMLRIGDWITFEKYGADGDVIEINLATVKVQNFDKTITTIPTYSLISDSFKNWRGMTNSPGRRIKRALFIKMSSVHFLSKEEVEKLKKIQIINPYVDKREQVISDYNQKNQIDKSLLINGRNLTNLGVFRKYVETYVEKHSGINKEMTLMVRQLAPTTQGIPIEIYAFSSDKRWENYEYIMADIFDHIIAAIPSFNLELFELPNNSNFEASKSIT